MCITFRTSLVCSLLGSQIIFSLFLGCLKLWQFSDKTESSFHLFEAKEMYRRMFETQKSGNKTSSGEIGLDIRTHASPKVGHEHVSEGVSVLRWHAAPVANVLWKPRIIRLKV